MGALREALAWQGRRLGPGPTLWPWPFSSLDIDIENSRATWDGQSGSLASSALGWRIPDNEVDWYNDVGTTIMIECSTDGTDTGEKALFQLLGGNVAFIASVMATSTGSIRLFNGSRHYPFSGPNNHNRYGRQRIIFTLSSASEIAISGFDPAGPISDSYAAPTGINGMTIGYRGDFNLEGFQNGVGQHIHRVVAWPFIMSEQQIRETLAWTPHRNICMVTDSIGGNNGNISVRNSILDLLYARGVKYCEVRVDARGGGGFTDNSDVYPVEETHANRFINSHPNFRRHLLITLDSVNAEDRLTAPTGINAMRAVLRGHDDFIVTGMWPNGTFQLAEKQAAQALLASSFGNNYANVLPAAQAAGDGGPEDLQDIADGLAPRSLRSDNIHQKHPEGDDVIADVIVSKMAALGLV